MPESSIARAHFAAVAPATSNPTGPTYSISDVRGGAVISLSDFGAVGDGVTDDTAAIQAAIDAAQGTFQGDPAALSSIVAYGNFRITDSLVLDDMQGFTLSGGGKWASMFTWDGDNSTPMFLLQDTSHCTFRDFSIRSAALLDTGFRIENKTGGTYTPTSCLFENIIIDGVKSDWGVNRGWDISDSGTGGDNNNEWHNFIHCHIFNYKEEGWRISGSNAVHERFFGCTFQSMVGTGKHGLWIKKSSFVWVAGGGSGNEVADFYFDDVQTTCSVIGGDFENSDRLLMSKSLTGATGGVNIQGTRWASAGLNADGNMIDFKAPSLFLIGNIFGSGNTSKTLKIKHRYLGAGHLLSIGKQFIEQASITT